MGQGLLIHEFSRSQKRSSTVGRTPLDEWSARLRDIYLTAHNTHNRKTFMPPVGFEPTVSAGERPQTYALDRAATMIGCHIFNQTLLKWTFPCSRHGGLQGELHILNLCYRWKLVVNFTPWLFYPWVRTPVLNWAREPVWTIWIRENSLVSTGFRTPDGRARILAAQ